MNINFVLRQAALTHEEMASLTKKAEFALDRFADHLEKVDCILEDINGPRGGDDKVCRLVLHLTGEPVVILQERGPTTVGTAMSALERAGHTLSRRRSKLVKM